MAGRGKMNSSPFHVESEQYAYAIEHENDGYQVREEIVDCLYYDKFTKLCSLWNSGFERCLSYKCPFFKSNLLKNRRCETCGYFYLDKCGHPSKPSKAYAKDYAAAFCCYYINKEQNAHQYYWIQECLFRMELTDRKNKASKSIKNCKACIRMANRQMQCVDPGTSDFRYLEEKKRIREEEIPRLEATIRAIDKKLNSHGGPLEEFPKNGKNKKSKR